MSIRYLIAGKNGQLAQEFIKKFLQQGIDHVAPDEKQLNITDRTSVSSAVAAHQPAVIINCAAYNLVDKAEQEQDKVYAVNALGAKHLAQAAAQHGAVLVHFGSDYVFDGKKENGLYTENDATNPLNEYGKSKLSGEQSIMDEGGRFLIFRLSWVFGDGKQNFIHKLTEWAGANEYLKIACDEFSVPTYTGTVVDAVLTSLEQGVTGRYHLTNTGYCSRYEWAQLILKSLGINKFVRPVSMDSFKLPAKRPNFSAMSNAVLAQQLDIEIPSWESTVSSFCKRMR